MPKISTATVAEHRRHTWEALLDAIDELTAERAFESISMRDVAARAGVTRTAIYNYAPDTITLLIAAIKRGSAEVREAVARRAQDLSLAPSERLRAIVTVLLLEFHQITGAFLSVQAVERSLDDEHFDEAVEPFRSEIGVHVLDVVRAGIEAGEFSAVADLDLTLGFMVGVMQSAVHKVSATSATRTEVAQAAADFLINALGAKGVGTPQRRP